MSIHLDIDLGPEQVDLDAAQPAMEIDLDQPTIDLAVAAGAQLDIDLEPVGQVDVGVDMPSVDVGVDLPSVDIGVPGDRGLPGPEGPPSTVPGPPGADSTVPGPQGPPGTVILFGVETPSSADGIEGDFYLDTDDHVLYGPKTGAVWPVAIAQGGAPPVQAAVFDFPDPLLVWLGVHGFNQRPVDVTLVDDMGEQFMGSVSFPNPNTVQATFAVPVAGHMLVQK